MEAAALVRAVPVAVAVPVPPDGTGAAPLPPEQALRTPAEPAPSSAFRAALQAAVLHWIVRKSAANVRSRLEFARMYQPERREIVETQVGSSKGRNRAAVSAMARLHVRLLGVPRLFVGDRAIVASAPPRTLPLLSFLLLRAPAVLPRRAVAEKLWPDSPAAQSRAELRRHVYYLDRLFESAALAGPSPVGRDAVSIWIDETALGSLDVRDFVAASRSMSAQVLQDALRLYAGELLEPYDDEWIVEERERLRSIYLDALARVVAAGERDGDFRMALRWARVYARAEPYREDPVRAIMRLCRDLGDAPGSLRAYEQFAFLLREELGAEPSRSLGEYAREIAAHPQNYRADRTLPLELTSFVGRHADVEELARRHRDERLTNLVGPPGVGKTRLAVRVARRIANDMPDGVWFIDLSRVPPGASVDRAIAEVLAYDRRSIDPDLPVAELLRDKQLTLVLDNCEHLARECAASAERVLKSAPAVRVLATSRSRLHVAGERVWLVDPLPAQAGIELFNQRAALARGERPESAALDQSRVAAVCEALDRLPLAIELAAARMRSMTIEDLERHVGQRFALLRRDGAADDDPHRTLLATFEWSYVLLDNRTRLLFERLATFAGGWTLAAAAILDARPELEVLDGLCELLNHSLVSVTHANGPQSRYTMLQSTREFAREKLRQRGGLQEARSAHAGLVARTFVNRSDDAFAQDRGVSEGCVEPEIENIRAALSFLLEERNDPARGVELVGSLGPFWVELSPRDEAIRWMEAALGSGAGTPHDILALHVFISRLLLRVGQGEAAARHADEAVERARVTGHADTLARALITRARAAWMLSHLDAARSDAREALELCTLSGNAFGHGRALSALYLAEISAGRVVEAERAAADATSIYRALRADLELAESLGNQGTCAYYAHDLERAYALYREAVDLLRGMRSNRIAAFAMHGLASLAWNRGEHDNAWALLVEALGIALEIGYAPVAVRCLEMVARWAGSAGMFYDAAVFSAASIAGSERYNVPFQPVELDDHRQVLRAFESGLDSQRRLQAQTEGANLTLEGAARRAITMATMRARPKTLAGVDQ